MHYVFESTELLTQIKIRTKRLSTTCQKMFRFFFLLCGCVLCIWVYKYRSETSLVWTVLDNETQHCDKTAKKGPGRMKNRIPSHAYSDMNACSSHTWDDITWLTWRTRVTDSERPVTLLPFERHTAAGPQRGKHAAPFYYHSPAVWHKSFSSRQHNY